MAMSTSRYAGFLCAVFCLSALIPVSAIATTRIVPAQYDTIQGGLDASSPGDTVLVEYGTYFEYDIRLVSGVTLKGEGDPESTIIDAQRQGGVLIADSLAVEVRVVGLTVTGGLTLHGGGLDLDGTTATVEGCVIVDNEVYDQFGVAIGGGIAVRNGASVTAVDSRIESNHADYEGGGIWVEEYASATLTRCVLRGNSAAVRGGPALWLDFYATATLQSCVVVENFQTSVHLFHGSVRSTIGANLDIRHCIFAYNPVGFVDCYESNVLIECSNVYANGDDPFWSKCVPDQQYVNGNFSVDPLFCDMAAGNFELDTLSPCLPQNSPTGCTEIVGAFGRGCGTEPPVVTIEPIPDDIPGSWELQGPDGYFLAGSGRVELAELDLGSYRLDWRAYEDWTLPDPAMVEFELEADSIFRLCGQYSRDIWRVPEDVLTIADACGFAESGDSIVLSQGVYSEHYLSLPAGVDLIGAAGDPALATIDGDGEDILYLTDADTTAVLEGLTFRNGEIGLTLSGASPSIRNCVFVENKQGVRINGSYSPPGLAEQAQPIRFEACTFSENRGFYSGVGLSARNASLELRSCVFENNAGDSYDMEGGAIRTEGGLSLVVETSVFTDNIVESVGGAIAAIVENTVIRSSQFVSNGAGVGGAIVCQDGIIEDCEFLQNTAWAGIYSSGQGGAILSSADIVGCLFVGNTASDGSDRWDQKIYGQGGAVSGGNVSHSTFFGNRASSGGTISTQGHVDHSIIVTVQGTSAVHSSATLDCVDLIPPDYGLLDVSGVPGAFSANPRFCDPENGRYDLQAISPCLPQNSPVGCTEIVGAYGEGCPTVSALVANFSLAQQGSFIVCEWQSHNPAADFRLRASDDVREWVVAPEALGGGLFRASDPIEALPTDTSVLYILEASLDDTWTTVHEQRVTVAAISYPTVLRGASPSPFAGETVIRFSLARTMRARLEVFDIRGRQVSVIHDGELKAGAHILPWRGVDSRGHRLGGGVYFLRLLTPERVMSRKVLMMR